MTPPNGTPNAPYTQVVKLGGSLHDLPDLFNRFQAYRATKMSTCAVLVVGGGTTANHVRQFDRRHGLGEEVGHWLAIRAMQFNTYVITAGLTRCRIVSDAEACRDAWENEELPVVDPLNWLEAEHHRGITIPHLWSFTSDSIAAHIATQINAQQLTLLKSTLPPTGLCSIEHAVSLGMIDAQFQSACASVKAIELINLRQSSPQRPPQRCTLR